MNLLQQGRWPKQKCQAIRKVQYAPAYERCNPDKTCRFPATVTHDGKYYCMRHAGELAVAILTKDQPIVDYQK